MKRQRGLAQDKQWLVLQFLRLSPSQRRRYAMGFVDSALRVNPAMLKYRAALLALDRKPGRKRR